MRWNLLSSINNHVQSFNQPINETKVYHFAPKDALGNTKPLFGDIVYTADVPSLATITPSNVFFGNNMTLLTVVPAGTSGVLTVTATGSNADVDHTPFSSQIQVNLNELLADHFDVTQTS